MNLEQTINAICKGNQDKVNHLLHRLKNEDITSVEQLSELPDASLKELGLSVGLIASLKLHIKSNTETTGLKPLEDMEFVDLLEELAAGTTRPKKLVPLLRGLGTTVVLVKDGKIQVQATVDLYEDDDYRNEHPQPGTVWGRDNLQVVSLNEYIGKRTEISPWDGVTVLRDGLDPQGVDYKQLSQEKRALMLYSCESPFRSHTDVYTCVEEMQKYSIEQLAQLPRWKRVIAQYKVDSKQDLNLEKNLVARLYPVQPIVENRARVPHTQQNVINNGHVGQSITISGASNIQIGSGNTQIIAQSVSAPLPKQSVQKINVTLWSNGWCKAFTELTDILSQLFDSPKRLRMLAQDAGVNVSRMLFDGSANTVAHELVLQAHHNYGCLDVIVSHAHQNYPTNKLLNDWIARYCQ